MTASQQKHALPNPGKLPAQLNLGFSPMDTAARLANFRPHSVGAHDLAVVCLLALLALYAGTNVFSPVRFDQEKIDVYAANGQIHVQGLYHYRNRLPLPVTFSLGLPFPVDAEHAVPFTYSVAEINRDGQTIREIATRNYHGNVVFRLFFLPSSEKWLRVDYLQNVAASNGKYILRTTRAWKQPLAHGEYVLHLGNSTKLTSSNYALQKLSGGCGCSYSFTKEKFFPADDWEFSWKPIAPLVTSRRDPR